MPLELVRNDLVNMRVDAVVNAANSRLQQGGGVCGAIFAAADAPKLQKACDRIGGCGVGEAVLTKSYGLPAPYIIHTVGPLWQGGGSQEEKLLRACYTRSLELARRRRMKSVAFPLISAGTFGMPRELAMATAIAAIGEYLMKEDMTVYLTLYDQAAYELGGKLYARISSFIDERTVQDSLAARRNTDSEMVWQQAAMKKALEKRADRENVCVPQMAAPMMASSLENKLDRAGESFSERLLRMIDARGMSDPEVYKRANLDRKLFSKIRGSKNYQPGKNTVLALAIALRLDLKETEELLRHAGYALSPGSKADLIVEYFIEQGNYSIHEINEALFMFDQKLLGAHS